MARKKYDISTHDKLPIGKELYLGGSDVCNRYLRRADGIIEIQRIVRWGTNGQTWYATPEEYDNWREKSRSMSKE